MSRVRAKAYGGQPSLQDMDTIVADISVGGYSDVEFSSFIMERAKEVVDLEDGLRLTFESSPGLLQELARVVDQERTCCSFLRFKLSAEPGTGPITFEVTVPPGTREMLRAL